MSRVSLHGGAHPYADVAKVRVVRVDGRGASSQPGGDREAGDAGHVVRWLIDTHRRQMTKSPKGTSKAGNML